MVLPVTDSRSSLHNSFADRKLSPLPMSSSLWPMNFVPQLLGLLHPRKPKYRTTFIGLVFFVFMTTYVFLVHGSALSPGPLRYADSPAADQLAIALESMQNSRANVEDSESVPLNIHRQLDPHRAGSRHRQHQVPVPVPVLKLTPEEELAAVSSFIASLPQNVIPPDVDPSLPIDPQLVLDFDTTRGSRAADEVRVMVEDVWTRNPVFVYSRLYSPASRELKTILANLHIYPSPTIVDIDTRDDVDVLRPLLARLTSTSELPLLLIGGEVVGTMENIREMAKDGRLQTLVASSGAIVNGARKKRGRKH